ncbi:hypothetical protein ACSQ76_00860 [Roseovarius sp. B08]|uniref:hypothetical protein n=1 Tax=Roseovarius sp. B08 TaxID=3449223 RepID=UPI003EDBE3AD
MLRDAQKMCNQVQNDRAVSIRHYEHHNSKTIALQRFTGLVGEDFGRFLSKPG